MKNDSFFFQKAFCTAEQRFIFYTYISAFDNKYLQIKDIKNCTWLSGHS